LHKRFLWHFPYSYHNSRESAEKRYDSAETKRALSSSEDESAPCVGTMPDARMLDSSLRQPGYPLSEILRRTRGFASPDFSGFACSENLLNRESTKANHYTALLERCLYHIKKGALSSW